MFIDFAFSTLPLPLCLSRRCHHIIVLCYSVVIQAFTRQLHKTYVLERMVYLRLVTRFSRQTTFCPMIQLAASSALGVKSWATVTRFVWVLLSTVTTPGGYVRTTFHAMHSCTEAVPISRICWTWDALASYARPS